MQGIVVERVTPFGTYLALILNHYLPVYAFPEHKGALHIYIAVLAAWLEDKAEFKFLLSLGIWKQNGHN